ncbi:MarR family winged helix-turn-helix transcriptional regulator [uncultured Oceanicoccus sp.]|uniref:MarR family winged helix-turn-helix transcriptional regulator n=1 Tax=uncultured Oceanicoccus sp. TaxID=1706381 RepID=UPI0030DAC5D8
MDTKPDFPQNQHHIYLEFSQQLLRYSKNFEQEISHRFRKHFNQSFTRFDLLCQLAKGEDPWQAIGKVANQLLASNGNITKLVERMVAEDLLIRRSSRKDRRLTEISMTMKGKQLHSEMVDANAYWTQSLMDNCLPEDEVLQLNSLLSKANAP